MISVCIATYNGETYIKDQLDSILIQLEDNDEVIISDDSSTDLTLEIIKHIGDKRIKIIPNQKFKSPVYNFENAIKNASGDIIFLSDQDDIWFKDKVVKVKEILLSYDAVVTDCIIVDKKLNIINSSFFNHNNSKKGLFTNIFKNSYLGCCMAFNKKTLKLILPFPKNIPMHDVWIGFVLELFFKTYFLNEPLLYYRRHGSNQSNTGEISPFSLSKKIQFRFNIIKHINKLIYRKLLNSINF